MMKDDERKMKGKKMTGEKMTGKKMTGEKMTGKKMTGGIFTMVFSELHPSAVSQHSSLNCIHSSNSQHLVI